MGVRKQITLPDDAAAILQSLTADCGMDQSLVVTQLLRRYHSHLKQLFAVDCSMNQPTAVLEVPTAVVEVSTPQIAADRRSELQQAPKPSKSPPRPPLTGL
jgi:hypothetical protein